MNAALEFAATYGPDKPLAELNRLVALRMKRMHELSQDAVAATAIDALVSLRAATRKASPAKSTEVKVEESASLVASHTNEGGARHRCLRTRGGQRVELRRVRFACDREARDRDLHVYTVTPEHRNIRSYIVVARSAKDAAAFEQRAARRRKENYGGLAKRALGVGMAQLSTRNAPTAEFKKKIADSRIIKVSAGNEGGLFSIEVHDLLGYSIAALNGGRAGVTLALMKASNKVAGILSKAAAKNFREPIPSPFPEVKKVRR